MRGCRAMANQFARTILRPTSKLHISGISRPPTRNPPGRDSQLAALQRLLAQLPGAPPSVGYKKILPCKCTSFLLHSSHIKTFGNRHWVGAWGLTFVHLLAAVHKASPRATVGTAVATPLVQPVAAGHHAPPSSSVCHAPPATCEQNRVRTHLVVHVCVCAIYSHKNVHMCIHVHVFTHILRQRGFCNLNLTRPTGFQPTIGTNPPQKVGLAQ